MIPTPTPVWITPTALPYAPGAPDIDVPLDTGSQMAETAVSVWGWLIQFEMFNLFYFVLYFVIVLVGVMTITAAVQNS